MFCPTDQHVGYIRVSHVPLTLLHPTVLLLLLHLKFQFHVFTKLCININWCKWPFFALGFVFQAIHTAYRTPC